VVWQFKNSTVVFVEFLVSVSVRENKASTEGLVSERYCRYIFYVRN